MMEDPQAPVAVTDELLAAWSSLADAAAPHMRLGGINWVMIVRSLIAEIETKRKAGGLQCPGQV